MANDLLNRFREKNPDYVHISDDDLVDNLHQQYRPNQPRDEFMREINYTPVMSTHEQRRLNEKIETPSHEERRLAERAGTPVPTKDEQLNQIVQEAKEYDDPTPSGWSQYEDLTGMDTITQPAKDIVEVVPAVAGTVASSILSLPVSAANAIGQYANVMGEDEAEEHMQAVLDAHNEGREIPIHDGRNSLQRLKDANRGFEDVMGIAPNLMIRTEKQAQAMENLGKPMEYVFEKPAQWVEDRIANSLGGTEQDKELARFLRNQVEGWGVIFGPKIAGKVKGKYKARQIAQATKRFEADMVKSRIRSNIELQRALPPGIQMMFAKEKAMQTKNFHNRMDRGYTDMEGNWYNREQAGDFLNMEGASIYSEDLQWMPGGNKLQTAVKDPETGKVYHGKSHGEAVEKAIDENFPNRKPDYQSLPAGKVDVPEFVDTPSAQSFGKQLRPEHVEQLKQRRGFYIAQQKRLTAQGKHQEAMDAATQAQFIREALEAHGNQGLTPGAKELEYRKALDELPDINTMTREDAVSFGGIYATPEHISALKRLDIELQRKLDKIDAIIRTTPNAAKSFEKAIQSGRHQQGVIRDAIDAAEGRLTMHDVKPEIVLGANDTPFASAIDAREALLSKNDKAYYKIDRNPQGDGFVLTKRPPNRMHVERNTQGAFDNPMYDRMYGEIERWVQDPKHPLAWLVEKNRRAGVKMVVDTEGGLKHFSDVPGGADAYGVYSHPHKTIGINLTHLNNLDLDPSKMVNFMDTVWHEHLHAFIKNTIGEPGSTPYHKLMIDLAHLWDEVGVDHKTLGLQLKDVVEGKLTPDQAHVVGMIEKIDEARSGVDISSRNPAASMEELVSYSLTDSRFAAWMHSMKTDKTYKGKPMTPWTVLKERILRKAKQDGADNTKLAQLNHLLDQHMSRGIDELYAIMPTLNANTKDKMNNDYMKIKKADDGENLPAVPGQVDLPPVRDSRGKRTRDYIPLEQLDNYTPKRREVFMGVDSIGQPILQQAGWMREVLNNPVVKKAQAEFEFDNGRPMRPQELQRFITEQRLATIGNFFDRLPQDKWNGAGVRDMWEAMKIKRNPGDIETLLALQFQPLVRKAAKMGQDIAHSHGIEELFEKMRWEAQRGLEQAIHRIQPFAAPEQISSHLRTYVHGHVLDTLKRDVYPAVSKRESTGLPINAITSSEMLEYRMNDPLFIQQHNADYQLAASKYLKDATGKKTALDTTHAARTSVSDSKELMLADESSSRDVRVSPNVIRRQRGGETGGQLSLARDELVERQAQLQRATREEGWHVDEAQELSARDRQVKYGEDVTIRPGSGRKKQAQNMWKDLEIARLRLSKQELRERTADFKASLKGRDKFIFDNSTKMSVTNMAKELGVSKQAVSKRLKSIMNDFHEARRSPLYKEYRALVKSFEKELNVLDARIYQERLLKELLEVDPKKIPSQAELARKFNMKQPFISKREANMKERLKKHLMPLRNKLGD